MRGSNVAPFKSRAINCTPDMRRYHSTPRGRADKTQSAGNPKCEAEGDTLQRAVSNFMSSTALVRFAASATVARRILTRSSQFFLRPTCKI